MVDAQLVITNMNCDTRYLPYKALRLQDTPNIKKLLNEIYSNKESIKLSCSCNPLKTSMVLVKTKNGRFFVKSKPNSKSNHLKCEFGLNEETPLKQSIYCPELILNDQGSYDLLGYNFSLKSTLSKRHNISLKLSSLGKELLARAWDYLMDSYKKRSHFYPDLNSVRFSLSNLFVGKKDYHRGILITPPKTNVKLENNLCLEDTLYLGIPSTAAIHAINKRYGVYALVFITLYNSELSEYDRDHYLLTFSVNNYFNGNTKVNRRHFILKKSLLKSAIETFSIEKVNHFDNFILQKKMPYYLMALARSDDYVSHPELIEIALIPVNNYGVLVRNIEERRFTNLLCVRRRIFKRPITKIHSKITPSFILYDSIKPTICEVIVDSNYTNDYFEFYNNQTDFLFYAWLAYKYTKITEDIPDIYKN